MRGLCNGAGVMGVLACALSFSACEMRNTVMENKKVARANPAVPGAAKSAQERAISPNKQLATDIIKPKGLTRQELNQRIQQAMLKKKLASDGSGAPQIDPTRPKLLQVQKSAVERNLRSTDFTKIAPDEASTAKSAPTAADLDRYIEDLGTKGKLMARIVTNAGAIECELYEERAPLTVANFVGLSRGLKAWIEPTTREPLVGVPLYQNVPFHRVIPKFMIQGGDPMGTGRGNPGYQIPDEFDDALKHDAPGILSMANAGPNTGGSQFFVTEVPTPHLNKKHSVFGRCQDIETIKQITGRPRNAMDRPEEEVIIEKIDIYRGNK